MTQKQFFNFIKAPFGKGFIAAFVFSFFSLLSIPLISNVINTLINIGNKLDEVPKDKRSAFIFNALAANVSSANVLYAVIGFVIFFLFLSVYCFVLIHKTVEENSDIFDASRLSAGVSEVFSVLFKYIGFVLIFTGGIFLSILPAFIFIAVATAIGSHIPVILSILLFVLSIVLPLYLLYKFFCYLYTASLIFYRDFKLSVFFDRQRVKAFFLEKKQSIFIAFWLSYVAGQIVDVITSSLAWDVFQRFLPFYLIFGPDSALGQGIAAIALLFGGFVFTYISILQAIVFGKIILWVERK